MNSKAELYSSVVSFQKKLGQGLSGLVKLDARTAVFMDELVEEGVVIKNDTGGSIGHPESNNFYTPSLGYNVWKDEEVLALTFVRFYLDVLEEESEIFVTRKQMVKDLDLLKRYTTWLERNKAELDIMDNLSDVYTGESDEDFTDTIAWLKKKEFYTNGSTIAQCIRVSNSTLQEQETLTRRLISLYRERNSAKDKDNILEAENDLNKQRVIRKKAERFLYRFDPDQKANEVI